MLVLPAIYRSNISSRTPAITISFLRYVYISFLLIILSFNTANPADKPSCSITGIVIDESTAKPVVAARVYLEKSSYEAFTDLSGAYRLEGIKPGRYTIHAELSGYSPFQLAKHTCSTGKTDTINIRMTRHGPDAAHKGRESNTGIIIGKVFDAVTQTPIAGAEVKIQGSSAAEKSAEDGLFTFIRIPAGTYTLYAEHPDYLSDSTKAVAMSDKSFKRVYFVLKRRLPAEDSTGTISGIVFDRAAGRPIAGASISLFDTDVAASADEAGQFELPRISAGMYTLMASKWGYEPQTAVVEVRARETTRRDFNLAARAAGIDGRNLTPGTIEGSITDESKNAIEGATVKIVESGIIMTTDMTGVFRFDSLPSGLYTLAAAFDGFAPSVSSEIYLGPAEAARIDFTLKKLSVATADTSATPAAASSIAGMVVDAQKQATLAGAVVEIVNTPMTAVTNPSGRYEFGGIKPGIYTLRFTHDGFKQKTAENIEVKAGMATTVDAALTPSDITEMDRATVRAAAVHTTGASLLKERKEQISFTDAIGAQEISRTGAGNAADAMKSVTGATVVGGKYVLIRGLPERYSITMLNGSPIPSPDPDRQAVNMDLFPSAVIENITVYKTFTPDLPANWAGGIVDIRTKPFPEEFTVGVSAGGGADWQTHFGAGGLRRNRDYMTYPGGSLDWLGMDDGRRAMPAIFYEATKVEIDENYFPWYEKNLRDSLRFARPNSKARDTIMFIDRMAEELDTTMTFTTRTALPNQSYAVSVGNTVSPADRPLGFFAALGYSNASSLSDGNIKRDYQFSIWQDTAVNEPTIENDFTRSQAKNTVLWGALATTSFRLMPEHLLRFDYMHTQNAIDNVEFITGYYSYYDDKGTYTTRILHYTQRSLDHFQVSGTHRLQLGGVPLHASWRGSYTAGVQMEPDRREFPYFIKETFPGEYEYPFVANLGEPSHQWRRLDERGRAAAVNLSVPFYQWSGDSATCMAGGSWYTNERHRTQREFRYRLSDYRATGIRRTMNPETFMSRQYMGILADSTKGIFILDESNDDAQTEGYLDIAAAYAMVQLPILGPLSLTSGLRYEFCDMFVATTVAERRLGTIGTLHDHDFLPSVSVAAAIRDNMSVRGAYARTLIRPSFREKSAYQEQEFSGGPSFLGNAALRRYFTDNADLRWEWFIKPGELLSAGCFYKRIHTPIELTFLENDVRKPVNTKSDADILGAEFEFRKQLDMVRVLKFFQAGGNLTLAWSRVKLDSALGADAEMAKNNFYFPDEPNHRPFQGQSPYVINVFLTFDQQDWGTNINVTYNVFGERLGELTGQELPWLWQKPEHSLTVTASKKFGRQIKVSAKGVNLLGADERFVMHYNGKEYTVKEVKKSMGLSAAISYDF